MASGGETTDEECMISATAAMAKDAAGLFQSGRYTECIDVLHQILQKKEEDPKVIHNIAVAEYFRDGCTDPRRILDVFHIVVKRSQELAAVLKDQMDEGNNAHGNSNVQLQVSSASPINGACADQFDTSIAKLNISVILFYLHEYTEALSVLDSLYQNIQPIDETVALHICLLLLDVALASHDVSKAADVIQYLEKTVGVSSMINQGDTSQNQSLNQPTKLSSTSGTSEASNLDLSTTNSNVPENSLARTLSDEADDDLVFSALNISSQNLARPSILPSSNDLSRTSTDLKLKLHLYKVRFFLLARNPKAAKREVKQAMNIARDRDSSTALLLKSQLEYARGNYRKAIKLLMTSSNRMESGMPSIFYNNLGCINHQLEKHHTSTMFFCKALKSSSALRLEKPLKLATFSRDNSFLITYNCGLEYLSCGKPIAAARCFMKASLVYSRRPLLWFRLAECCLLALEMGILKSPQLFSNKEVNGHVVGTGKWRHLILGSSQNGYHRDPEEHDDSILSLDHQSKLSVPFSRQCLLNALHLLDGFENFSKHNALIYASEESMSGQTISMGTKNSDRKKTIDVGDHKISAFSSQVNSNGDSKESKGGASSNAMLHNSISSYYDIQRKDNLFIRQAILADLAYIELTLEDPLKALSTARALLQLQDCSKIYVFLGRLYAAEALCRLNRPKDAAEILSIFLLDGIDVVLPYNDDDRERWRMHKSSGDGEDLNIPPPNKSSSTIEEYQPTTSFLNPKEAQGVLYVNLATMFAMEGDLDQANHFVSKALLVIPNNPQAVLASVYVDLLHGRTQEALSKLKQSSSRVRFS